MGVSMSDAASVALHKSADEVASSSTAPSLIFGIFNRGSTSHPRSCRLKTGRALRLDPLPLFAPKDYLQEPTARYSWLPAAGLFHPSRTPVAYRSEFVEAGMSYGTDPTAFIMTLNGLDGMVAWSVSEYFCQAVEEDAHREMAEVVEAGQGGTFQILKEAEAENRDAGNEGIELPPLYASVPRQRAEIHEVQNRRPRKHLGKRQIPAQACVIADSAGVKAHAHGDALVQGPWRKTAWVDGIAKRRTSSVQLRRRWRMYCHFLLQLSGKNCSLFQQEGEQMGSDYYNVPPVLVTEGIKSLIQGGLVPQISSSFLDRLWRKQTGSLECCCHELVLSWQKRPLLGQRSALTGSRLQHFQVPPPFLLRVTCRLSSLKLLCIEIPLDPDCTWDLGVMKRGDSAVYFGNRELYGCAQQAIRGAGTTTMHEVGRLPGESVDSGSLTAHEQQQNVGLLNLENSWVDKQRAMLMSLESRDDRAEVLPYPADSFVVSRWSMEQMDWSCGNVYKAGHDQTEAVLRTSTSPVDSDTQVQEISQSRLDHHVERRCGWVIRVAVTCLVRRQMQKCSISPLASCGVVARRAVKTSARWPVAKTGMLLGSWLVGSIWAFKLSSKAKTSKIARTPTQTSALGVFVASLAACVLSLITVTTLRLGRNTHWDSDENLNQRRAPTRAAVLKAMSPYRNILLFLNPICGFIHRNHPRLSMTASVLLPRVLEDSTKLATSEM